MPPLSLCRFWWREEAFGEVDKEEVADVVRKTGPGKGVRLIQEKVMIIEEFRFFVVVCLAYWLFDLFQVKLKIEKSELIWDTETWFWSS